MGDDRSMAITPSPVTMRVVERLWDAIDNHPALTPNLRALLTEAAGELHQIAVDVEHARMRLAELGEQR